MFGSSQAVNTSVINSLTCTNPYPAIGGANLPTIENIKEKFFYSSDDMKEPLGQALASNVEFKLTEGQKFRLENAFRSLRLLQSDENIERHAVSNLDSYGSYAYHGLPNIR